MHLLPFVALLACVCIVILAPRRSEAQFALDFRSLMSIGDEFYDLLKPLLSSPSDVVFLIDASASVSLPHFKAELHIVDAVLFSFDVSRDGNRVAVVTYSTDVHPDHWNSIANPSLTKCDLRQRLHNIPYIPGWRNTGVGLVRAGQILGSSSRSGVNRVVITLTDGQASHGPDVATSAADVISLGATLFALGFGGIGVAGLQVAASSSRHVFFIGEPGNLDPFSSTLLRDRTCLCIQVENCITDVFSHFWSERCRSF